MNARRNVTRNTGLNVEAGRQEKQVVDFAIRPALLRWRVEGRTARSCRFPLYVASTFLVYRLLQKLQLVI